MKEWGQKENEEVKAERQEQVDASLIFCHSSSQYKGEDTVCVRIHSFSKIHSKQID